MRFSLAAALTLATAALAAPAPGPLVARQASLSNVKMPSNTLPAPASGSFLKYLVLGVGTQNYTCANGDAATVPAAVGAVAALYDASSLNSNRVAAMLIPAISPLALAASQMGDPALQAYLRAMKFERVAGKHYFTAGATGLVPTFSLDQLSGAPVARVKKGAAMPAPSYACKGTKGEGAVDWLELLDNGSSTGPISKVYRVETAGGKAPANCQGAPASFTVPYATQYWVYATA